MPIKLLIVLLLFLAPSFAWADITTSLGAYYKFDEGSGTSAADSSGNAITATATNTPSWITGQVNSATTLNGSTEFWTIPTSTNVNFAQAQNFTVALWVKIPATQADVEADQNNILEKWDNSLEGAYPFVVRLWNQTAAAGDQGKPFLGRYDGTNNPLIETTVTLNDNAWHHLAWTKSGATISVYVDGAFNTSGSDTTSGTTTNGSDLYVGSRAGDVSPVNFYQGGVDEVRIYTRALTASDISELYASKISIIKGATIRGIKL